MGFEFKEMSFVSLIKLCWFDVIVFIDFLVINYYINLTYLVDCFNDP